MADFWIEVNLDSVIYNYKQVVDKLSPGAQVMAVVKADAYGLGAVDVARALAEEGCAHFAVTTIEEGCRLRQAGIVGVILVLGPSLPADWPRAVACGLELTAAGPEHLRQMGEWSREEEEEVPVHLKVETGMGRIGFWPEEAGEAAAILRACQGLHVAGVYTHFARIAQSDVAYTESQYTKYADFVRALEEQGIPVPVKHVCNSGAFLAYPQYHHQLVRIGTLLTGHYPAPAFSGKIRLADPWQAKATILHVREAPQGTFVGYQSVYRTRRQVRLAVIGVGYSHGFGVEPRFRPQGISDLAKIIMKNTALLFGKQLGGEKILWNGQEVRVAGKIGMQLTVLDMGTADCRVGDEIGVPVRRTLANPGVERCYTKNGRIVKKGEVGAGFS